MTIRTRFYHSCSKVLPQCNIRVIFQSKHRLRNLFRFKDVIPKELRSHLVYKYTCSSCNATYYGKTDRHFKVRASEHLGITPLTGKHVKNRKMSAIADRFLFSNHHGSLDDFSILCSEPNSFKLLIKESLLISRDMPSLNKNVYSTPLKLFN